MATGHQADRNEINELLGTVAGDLDRSMRRMNRLIEYLNTADDTSLTGMGFSPQDIQEIRGFENRGRQLFNIFSGSATLATAFNFQGALRRFWGARID